MEIQGHMKIFQKVIPRKKTKTTKTFKSPSLKHIYDIIVSEVRIENRSLDPKGSPGPTAPKVYGRILPGLSHF